MGNQVETKELIDSMRLLSITNEKLYDVQILNLKCIPLVLFGEDLENEFRIDFDKRTILFTLTGKSNFPEAETEFRLQHLVQYVQRLIGNFEVSVILNEKVLDGKQSINSSPKGRDKPKRSRKKGIRKVPKRR